MTVRPDALDLAIAGFLIVRRVARQSGRVPPRFHPAMRPRVAWVRSRFDPMWARLEFQKGCESFRAVFP